MWQQAFWVISGFCVVGAPCQKSCYLYLSPPSEQTNTIKANFPAPWCRDSVYSVWWVNHFYSHQPLIYTNKSDADSCTAAKLLQINKLNTGIWLVLLFLIADSVWTLLCTNKNYISCFTCFICIKYLPCAHLEELRTLIRQRLAGTFSLSGNTHLLCFTSMVLLMYLHTHAHHPTSTHTDTHRHARTHTHTQSHVAQINLSLAQLNEQHLYQIRDQNLSLSLTSHHIKGFC